MHPLEGITVVDLTAGVSGPHCTRMLGDWGARVIKIEPPGRGDLAREWDSACEGLSSCVVWANRNKESVALDLKRPREREALLRLVETADVLVENFTPGTISRLGLDTERLQAINPRLIVCHISGYGQTGPYAQRRAFDFLVQGEAGILAMNGTEDQMCKVPLSICDIGAGMYAVAAICAALNQRAATGKGAEIEISMFEAMLDWLSYFPHLYWHRQESPRRLGARHHLLAPYGPYATAEGKVVNLAVLTQDHWSRFCKVIGRPDWISDARFIDNESRILNRVLLDEELSVIFKAHDVEYWIECLDGAHIPCGLVNDLPDVMKHPQIAAMDFIRSVPSARGDLPTFDNPVRWRGLTTPMGRVPELGENTVDILREVGYGDDDVSEFAAVKGDYLRKTDSRVDV